jgi:parallel beta-helix repeat protein
MREPKTALILILILCLSIATFSNVELVKATSIYIHSDGSIEGTDKIQRDENFYTLTDNIYNSTITVLKDDIVVDGAGHILRGQPSGIVLLDRDNVTIKNFIISTNYTSDNIQLYYSSNCAIINNTITPFIESYPGTGIAVWGGASNVIDGNQIMNNLFGIYLGEGTSNNSIFGNSITNNTHGLRIHYSQNNSIYNNYFSNKFNVHILEGPSGTTIENHFDNNTMEYSNNTDLDEEEIPEFPSLTPIFFALTVIVVAVFIYRRKLPKI